MTDEGKRRLSTRRLRRGLAVAICIVAWLLLWPIVYTLFGPNWHPVIPGKVYRSAQLPPAVLPDYVRSYGIRTIVNLRGAFTDSRWYGPQRRVVDELGITQVDLHLSVFHAPPPEKIRRFIEILETAEYPILIHCRRGADRTGIASTIVLLLQDGISYHDATAQLSLHYGHFGIGKTRHFHEFLRCYEDWLQKTGQEHSAALFRHWAMNIYNGIHNATITAMRFPHGIRQHRPVTAEITLRSTGWKALQFRPTKAAGVHIISRWNGLASGKPGPEQWAGFLAADVLPDHTMTLRVPIAPMPAGRHQLTFYLYLPRQQLKTPIGKTIVDVPSHDAIYLPDVTNP